MSTNTIHYVRSSVSQPVNTPIIFECNNSPIIRTIPEKRHNEVQAQYQTHKIARLRGYMRQKVQEEHTINKTLSLRTDAQRAHVVADTGPIPKLSQIRSPLCPLSGIGPIDTPYENHQIPNCIDDFGTITGRDHNEVISYHQTQKIARLRGYMRQNAKQCIGSKKNNLPSNDWTIPERGHNSQRICDSVEIVPDKTIDTPYENHYIINDLDDFGRSPERSINAASHLNIHEVVEEEYRVVNYYTHKLSANNILFVDSNVPQYQTIVDSVNASTTPIVYSRLSTKTEILQRLKQIGTKINRIGFCFESNGPTYMFLDEQPLFLNSESEPYILTSKQMRSARRFSGTSYPSSNSYACTSVMSSLRNRPNKNTQFIIDLIKEFNVANIDFFACDTLRFPDWKNYYDLLFRETGVVVGASDNKTGNLKYGGDWVMESTNQDVEFIYFTENIECYRFLLGVSRHIHVVTMNSTYGIGNNEFGQLGIGTDGTDANTKFTPTTNFLPYGKKVKSISCGQLHTIALLDDRTIYSTGLNDCGQLGKGNNGPGTNTKVFTPITDFPPSRKQVKSISCGQLHTIALLDDGTVYSTGKNLNGQLGISTNDDTNVFTTTNFPPLGKTVKSISCGQSHTIALLDDGTIYGTGYNLFGQLGIGTNGTGADTNVFTPTTHFLPYDKKVKSISCGQSHTIALLNDGTIYSTGENVNGQLGIGTNGPGTNTDVFTPTTHFLPYDKKVKSISCGQYYTIALLDDGTIYGTGILYIQEKNVFTKMSIPKNEFGLSINDMTPLIGPLAPPTITNINSYKSINDYMYEISVTPYYNNESQLEGTTYYYSTDNWATYKDANTNSSPFNITLQQQLSTPISIKEYSNIELSFSAASNSITVGTNPSIISIRLAPRIASIIVRFTGSMGGVPSVTKYQYSIKKYDENAYTNFKDVDLNYANQVPFTIRGLDTTATYSVIMRAVSESGTTSWTSSNSDPASVSFSDSFSASFSTPISNPIITMKSAFTDNSKIFYKPGSLSCGIGSTKNYRHKSKHT